jgi:hypothetical protein
MTTGWLIFTLGILLGAGFAGTIGYVWGYRNGHLDGYQDHRAEVNELKNAADARKPPGAELEVRAKTGIGQFGQWGQVMPDKPAWLPSGLPGWKYTRTPAAVPGGGRPFPRVDPRMPRTDRPFPRASSRTATTAVDLAPKVIVPGTADQPRAADTGPLRALTETTDAYIAMMRSGEAAWREESRLAMTLAMPDSIFPANLPPGYPAYLGYVDGSWPTAPALRKQHPDAEVIGLTVTGATLDADGCDMEKFDLSQSSGARWLARKLAADPDTRPVGYASVSWMPEVIADLEANSVPRADVRLLSAHYDRVIGKHICGPMTCAWPGVPAMDGTQWTNTFPGSNGTLIDMSELRDDFFSGIMPPVPEWQVQMMQALPTIKQGATGGHVRTVQGLCNARGLTPAIAIDGVFGPATDHAVRIVQSSRGLAADGIVGPQTWPALMGV